MNEPINPPDPGEPFNVSPEGRARGDRPAELDPAMAEAATRAAFEANPPENMHDGSAVTWNEATAAPWAATWKAWVDRAEKVARAALSAAGVPGLVAEVERWKREWQEGDRAWAEDRARATSAERREQGLRAGIEVLIESAPAEPHAIEPQYTPVVAVASLRALLAGSGEQPGEDWPTRVNRASLATGRALAATNEHEPNGRCQADNCPGPHPGEHRPAPVVPDSADVRERVREAVFRNSPYVRGVRPDERNVDEITDAVLAVVGQGVTAEQEMVCRDCGHSMDEHSAIPGGRCLAPFTTCTCAAVRPTGQEGS